MRQWLTLPIYNHTDIEFFGCLSYPSFLEPMHNCKNTQEVVQLWHFQNIIFQISFNKKRYLHNVFFTTSTFNIADMKEKTNQHCQLHIVVHIALRTLLSTLLMAYMGKVSTKVWIHFAVLLILKPYCKSTILKQKFFKIN